MNCITRCCAHWTSRWCERMISAEYLDVDASLRLRHWRQLPIFFKFNVVPGEKDQNLSCDMDWSQQCHARNRPCSPIQEPSCCTQARRWRPFALDSVPPSRAITQSLSLELSMLAHWQKYCRLADGIPARHFVRTFASSSYCKDPVAVATSSRRAAIQVCARLSNDMRQGYTLT